MSTRLLFALTLCMILAASFVLHANICSVLPDEHFGDELHPNGRGANIIAEAMFQVLRKE